MPARAATWAVAATVVAPGRAARDARAEVAQAQLLDPVGERDLLQRGVVEADPHPPAEHGDRRRHGAPGADGVLDLARHPQVVGPRQAVGDDRRLQRHHGPALRERRGDLVVDLEHQMRAGCQTHRAASSAAYEASSRRSSSFPGKKNRTSAAPRSTATTPAV